MKKRGQATFLFKKVAVVNQIIKNTRSPRFTCYEILQVGLTNRAPTLLKKVACPLLLKENKNE
jgi:hypothetical protein